ncbi:MAG: flagellar biosynthesis protein FlhF [Desulfobacterales bacterium]|nr:flagellar biosynthesis protein FlhF [Desulfobacterales bacterium]
MQIKRFEAENMAEALKLVKQEFGSDAVILSAKSLDKKTGVFGYMRRPGVEVTAAKDTFYPETEKTSSGKIRKFENSGNKKSLIGSFGKGRITLKNKPNDIFQNPDRELADLKQQMLSQNHDRELADLKQQMLSQDYDRELADLKQQMLSQDVEESIIRKLIEKVNRIAPQKKLLKDNELKLCLIRVLKEMGITAGPIRIEPGKQKVIAFIGPTGVGKTTTIAKIAAIQAVKMKKQVALITLDNHRIGGIDQLKIYAKIIGIPIEVASTEKEFKECLKKLKDKDLVLIDTAGISKTSEYKFNELRIFLNKVRCAETCLLLSATTKDDDLIDILAKFKVFPVSSLLITKLDESTSYGNIFNQLIRSAIPVSYLTTGQRVPEDIENATLEKLVNLIINKHEKRKDLPDILEVLSSEDREKIITKSHFREFHIANKNSNVFRHSDCKAAKRVNKENVVVFKSILEATKKKLKPRSRSFNEKEYNPPYEAVDRRKTG